jgi:hypothetical protein
MPTDAARVEAVEAVLARLMPPALSHGRQSDIEAMLDGLAAPGPVVEGGDLANTKLNRGFMLAGLAAAITGLLAVVFFAGAPTVSSLAFVLTDESERVESVESEEWQEDSTGAVGHAYAVSVKKLSHYKDSETGISIQIEETRKETVFVSTPISHF